MRTVNVLSRLLSRTASARSVLLSTEKYATPRTFHASLLSPSARSKADEVAAVKELRERTGAPMMAVKSCLVASDWDIEEAFKELRKKGLAAAAKKASRTAADGLLGVLMAPDSCSAVIVEVNSETDFVARTPQFQQLVSAAAAAALKLPFNNSLGYKTNAEAVDVASVMNAPMSQAGKSTTIADSLTEVSLAVGENVLIRRAARLRVPSTGVFGSYLHSSPGEGLAKMAAVVSLEVNVPQKPSAVQDNATEKCRELAKSLAMHAVAAKPRYITKEQVKEGDIENEVLVLRAQAMGAGKPPAVVNKIVEGRLNKFFEETVMLEQKYTLDNTKTVKDVINETAKTLGVSIKLVDAIRMQVGEGMERVEKNFAEEVSAAAQSAGAS
eukprot:jgi/Mesvir1/17183/Mv07604-RA.1